MNADRSATSADQHVVDTTTPAVEPDQNLKPVRGRTRRWTVADLVGVLFGLAAVITAVSHFLSAIGG